MLIPFRAHLSSYDAVLTILRRLLNAACICVISHESQMKILYHELGNDRVNAIWEMNIPAGWTKPTKVLSRAVNNGLNKYCMMLCMDVTQLETDTDLMHYTTLVGINTKVLVIACNISYSRHPLKIARSGSSPSTSGLLLSTRCDTQCIAGFVMVIKRIDRTPPLFMADIFARGRSISERRGREPR